MNRKLITLLALPALLITACISSVDFVGGHLCKSEIVSDVQARYDITKCVTTHGETVQAPIATYTITGRGEFIELIEYDHVEKLGVRIYNHDVDRYGNHHFLIYQEGGNAWLYKFPPTGDVPATRSIYRDGKYEVIKRTDGKVGIKGQYFIICYLKRR